MDIKQIKENKFKKILQFSIPSIIAMLLQTVITITDGFFNGNYVGEFQGFSPVTFYGISGDILQVALKDRKSVR